MAGRRTVNKSAHSAQNFDMIDLVEVDNDADDESTHKSFDSNDSLCEFTQKSDLKLPELGLINNKEKVISPVDGDEERNCTSPVIDSPNADSSVFDSEDNKVPENDAFGLLKRQRKPKLVSVGSSNSTSSTSDFENDKQNRKRSAVEGLLFEIYERYSAREMGRSIDSDTITECSTTSSTFYFASSLENDESCREKLDRAYLVTKGPSSTYCFNRDNF